MKEFFKKVFNFALVIIFLAVVLFFYTYTKNIGPHVKIAGQIIRVEVADIPESQAQGLSARQDHLAGGEGMLFVFDAPGRYGFWMKDMNFPIDIIWLGEDMKVVYIVADADPTSYPAVFSPDTDAKYVLEVPAGFSRTNNLKVGDKVDIA